LTALKIAGTEQIDLDAIINDALTETERRLVVNQTMRGWRNLFTATGA
jgi:hypothetical protein